jgi:hypothetical protein
MAAGAVGASGAPEGGRDIEEYPVLCFPEVLGLLNMDPDLPGRVAAVDVVVAFAVAVAAEDAAEDWGMTTRVVPPLLVMLGFSGTGGASSADLCSSILP